MGSQLPVGFYPAAMAPDLKHPATGDLIVLAVVSGFGGLAGLVHRFWSSPRMDQMATPSTGWLIPNAEPGTRWGI